MSRRAGIARITGVGIALSTLLWLVSLLWLSAQGVQSSSVLVDVAVTLVGVAPALAAARGLYAGRYGAVAATLGAVLTTAFGAVVGAIVWFGGAPDPTVLSVTSDVKIMAAVSGLSVLTALVCWPLSIALGYLDYSEGDHDGVARWWALLTGPLFPVVVALGPILASDVGGLRFAVLVGVVPFACVGLARSTFATDDGVGSLTVPGRVLWTLGTRPLVGASAGAGLLAGTGLVASWLLPGGLAGVLTLEVVVVTTLVPWGVGTVYVLTTVGTVLGAVRDSGAPPTPDAHSEPVETVTLLDVESRFARFGPPRQVAVVHLSMGVDSLLTVTDRRVDVAALTSEAVGEHDSHGVETPVAATDGDRVRVTTDDGDIEATPYGDPERVVSAVDRRYDPVDTPSGSGSPPTGTHEGRPVD